MVIKNWKVRPFVSVVEKTWKTLLSISICYFFLFSFIFDGAEEDMAARLSLVVLFFSLKHRNDTLNRSDFE